ncbi:MAG: PKD domain-containing protein, partial [Bacteroidota bacterium]
MKFSLTPSLNRPSTASLLFCLLFSFLAPFTVAKANVVNDPPVAAFTFTPNGGTAPVEISFNGTASNDPNGDEITAYAWDFGDGNTGSGQFTTHTYSTTGTYTISLTVTDANGAQSAPAQMDITITPPQNAPELDPIGDLSATEGETRQYFLNATDLDQGDQLTFSVNAELPAFANLVDNGDGSALLTITPGVGDAGSYPGITFSVSDGSLMDEETVTLVVEAAPTVCSPISTLPCADVQVTLPYNLTFDGFEGGILAGNGPGTGFTMVDPPSINQYPSSPSDPAVPGLEASLLNVSGGLLTLTTTKGINLGVPPSNGANTLVNGLGVGIESPGSVFNVEASMAHPNFAGSVGAGVQQAGIWFGINEDNYVKLVARKVSDRSARVELTVEQTDPNAPSSVLTSEIIAFSFENEFTNTLAFRLEIDPVYNQVRGYYTRNGGGEELVEREGVSVLSFPESFQTGVDHDGDGNTAALSFAGIMASQYFADAANSLDIEYEDFSVSVAPYTPTLIFDPASANVSIIEGETAADLTVELFTNDGTTPTLTLSDDPASAAWLTIPAATTPGSLTFSFASGLNEGTYATTVLAVANGYVTGEFDISLVVSDPANIPRVLGTIPADGATDVPLNTSISANELFLPNDLNGIFGVENSTINQSTVRLFRDSDNFRIPATVNGTGGGDAINLTPSIPLEINQTYRFEIDGVQDLAGVTFAPFSSTFTTADDVTGSGTALDNVSFSNAGNVATNGMYTSLAIGPDGKFYALSINGDVDRWTIESDGSLSNQETITTLTTAYGQRSAIGFVFAPDATATDLRAFVSHATGVLNNGAPWDGKISRLSGANLEQEDLVVTNLPRSRRDHLVNSL